MLQGYLKKKRRGNSGSEGGDDTSTVDLNMLVPNIEETNKALLTSIQTANKLQSALRTAISAKEERSRRCVCG